MVRFLSDAWIERLDAILQSEVAPEEEDPHVDGEPVDGQIVVEQVVTDVAGAPEGIVSYHLVVDRSGARVVSGKADDPDVTLVLDARTATRVARGELNAQQALAAGDGRLRGHPERLATVAPRLRLVADALGRLRDETEFEE
jgi:hypothetical protein